MNNGKVNGLVVVAMAVVFCCAGVAQAFPKVGLPKVGGAAAGGTDIKQMKADLKGKTADSLKQCSVARLEFIGAQGLLLEALGLKAEYATKLAEAKTLAEGNASASDLKKAQMISKEANEAIKAKSAEAGELSPAAKEKFAEGLTQFSKGVAIETAQVAVIAGLVTAAQDIAKNASGLQKAGAIAAGKPALDLAAMIPGDVKEATSTLGAIISVAKKQNIKVPKDATDLL